MPTQLSQLLLYINAGLSALTVLGHTKMGYDVVFPSLQRGSSGGAKGKGKEGILDNGAKAARIGWLEVNQGFVVMCMLDLPSSPLLPLLLYSSFTPLSSLLQSPFPTYLSSRLPGNICSDKSYPSLLKGFHRTETLTTCPHTMNDNV